MEKKTLSLIIPVYNEEENLEKLYSELKKVLFEIKSKYEIIFIDDGSSDNSLNILKKISKYDENIVVISFVKNFGQSAAFLAGFELAKNDIFITLDADLQNDPLDIPKLIKEIDNGFDTVTGWRKNRKDFEFKKIFLSKIANILISKICGLKINDTGCSLKAYKKEIAKNIKIYGEMHRFLPMYAFLEGAKIGEIEVNHRPRIHGQSKYGMERIIKVILDLIVVKFLEVFLKKPFYLFGGFSIMLLILSAISLFFAIYLKFNSGISLIQTPLPIFSSMAFVSGIICLLFGLIAEVVIRIYFEKSATNRSYKIKEIIKK